MKLGMSEIQILIIAGHGCFTVDRFSDSARMVRKKCRKLVKEGKLVSLPPHDGRTLFYQTTPTADEIWQREAEREMKITRMSEV